MKVYAVGGKAFFHKDELKQLGFRWYREPKLWVIPESDDNHPNLEDKLNAMNGVRWDVQDLPVEDMFRRSAPSRSASAENRNPSMSSLERARSAAAKIEAAPEAVLAVSEPDPKEELDFTPELTRLRGRIAAMRMMLKEIEQDAESLAARVEC